MGDVLVDSLAEMGDVLFDSFAELGDVLLESRKAAVDGIEAAVDVVGDVAACDVEDLFAGVVSQLGVDVGSG